MFMSLWKSEEINSTDELSYVLNQSECRIMVNNQSKYAIDIFNGNTLENRVNPYSYSLLPNGDYTLKLNRSIVSKSVQESEEVTLRTAQSYENMGSTTFQGNQVIQGDVTVNGTVEVAGNVNVAGNVGIDGEVAVNGSVNIANVPEVTFAPNQNVNIANTPEVILQNNTVTIGNTPNVAIQGTPTVQFAPNQNVNIAGTPTVNLGSQNTVNIGNTPNVAIQGTPTVQIANNQNINVTSMPALQIASNQNINANIQNAQLNSNILNAVVGTKQTVQLDVITMSAFAGANLQAETSTNGSLQKVGQYDGIIILFSSSNHYPYRLEGVTALLEQQNMNASGVVTDNGQQSNVAIYQFNQGTFLSRISYNLTQQQVAGQTLNDTLTCTILTYKDDSLVTVQGTPTVTIQNTPTINIANGQNVGISGTPNVNINNVPTVNAVATDNTANNIQWLPLTKFTSGNWQTSPITRKVGAKGAIIYFNVKVNTKAFTKTYFECIGYNADNSVFYCFQIPSTDTTWYGTADFTYSRVLTIHPNAPFGGQGTSWERQYQGFLASKFYFRVRPDVSAGNDVDMFVFIEWLY